MEIFAANEAENRERNHLPTKDQTSDASAIWVYNKVANPVKRLNYFEWSR